MSMDRFLRVLSNHNLVLLAAACSVIFTRRWWRTQRVWGISNSSMSSSTAALWTSASSSTPKRSRYSVCYHATTRGFIVTRDPEPPRTIPTVMLIRLFLQSKQVLPVMWLTLQNHTHIKHFICTIDVRLKCSHLLISLKQHITWTMFRTILWRKSFLGFPLMSFSCSSWTLWFMEFSDEHMTLLVATITISWHYLYQTQEL